MGAMSRNAILLRALLVVCACSPLAAEPNRPQRPNVLLVTLDTTRADHLGCYDATDVSTPNLDALARRGVRFDQAISPAPLTLPSHASMLTGLVPRRHGVRVNALFSLDEEVVTMPAILSRHGYDTAAFVSSVVLDRITGLDRGFRHYDDSVRIGPREAFDYRERAAVQTTDAVIDYLERLEPPFFLWVHYYDPHLPYVPPEPFRGRFGDHPYDGEIAFMDSQFGRLLQAVEGKGGPLLTVVAGDHGESLGEHGEQAHGLFIYQPTQRVPFIAAGQGLPSRKVFAEPVGLVDMAPTVLDLLGLPSLPDTDGRSLLPLIRGKKKESRDYEMESLFPYYAYCWAPLRGLVSGGYKFIDAPAAELYSLAGDQGEEKDVIFEKPELASTLERKLRELTAEDVAQPIPEAEMAEQRRELEALGYLSGSAPRAGGCEIDPKEGVTWIADLEAGRRAYQTGRPAEGIEPLKRLLARNPRNIPALLALSSCHLGAGEPSKAVAACRRAAALQPRDDLVLFNLANALAAAGESGAGESYEQALAINPRFADAYLNYGSLLLKAGSDEEALALLEMARAADVADPDIENRIALLQLKKGNLEAAKAALLRSLELRPRDAATLEALGSIEKLLEIRETPRSNR
jgi:arylsulfatase A-like enzyme/Tfp pilus assembly protein PilF